MSIWQAVQRIDRLVFTTREISALTGMSLSSAAQGLARLEKRAILKKVMRGLWAMVNDRRFSALMVVPFLSPSQQSYVSFISALHLYGIISQIPQMVTVASTAHSKKIITPVGVYSVHQIAPGFFSGFRWHESRHYLIAAPEKALVDCLYISSRRGRNYLSFPELELPRSFKRKEAIRWAKSIRDPRVRESVLKKLQAIL